MESEFTEEEYADAERTTDRMVGLWLLAITLPLIPAAFVALWLDVDITVAAIPFGVLSIVLFLWWAKGRTRGLPRQRQTVRPVRGRWLVKAFAICLIPVVVVIVALLFAA